MLNLFYRDLQLRHRLLDLFLGLEFCSIDHLFLPGLLMHWFLNWFFYNRLGNFFLLLNVIFWSLGDCLLLMFGIKLVNDCSMPRGQLLLCQQYHTPSRRLISPPHCFLLLGLTTKLALVWCLYTFVVMIFLYLFFVAVGLAIVWR